MIPYFAFASTLHALFTSIGVTVLILILFGYGKAWLSGCNVRDSLWSVAHTVLVGVVAAGTSYGIVKGIDSIQPASVM